MKGKKILARLLCAAVVGNMAFGIMPGTLLTTEAASTNSVKTASAKAGSTQSDNIKHTTEDLEKKKYNDVPAYQYKDLYTTARVTIKNLEVEEVVNATMNPIYATSLKKEIKFVIYNTTKQEVDQTVMSENGKLPDVSLINNNNYMIYAEDTEYRMPCLYVWVRDGKLYNIKKISWTEVNGNKKYNFDYPEVDTIQMYKRDKEEPNPENDRRVSVNLPVYYKNNTGMLRNVKIKLISPVETLECNTGESGRIFTQLLEDQNYMIEVENDNWDIDSFPLVAKDKSEYGGARYAYNHSSCAKVDELRLVNKGETHQEDTILESKSGNTVVSGLNFKDMLLYDKTLSKDLVTELSNEDYDVVDISAVNPHRWERAKLAAGDYQITESVPSGKSVKNLYYLDENKKLVELPFTKEGRQIHFTMHSLGMYPVVMEYEKGAVVDPTPSPEPTPSPDPTPSPEPPVEKKVAKIQIKGGLKDIAAGKKVQLKAIVSPENAKNKKVKWTTSNKKYATVTASGKVTVNKAGAGKKVTITATATDGSKKSASYTIRIRKSAVKKLTLKVAKTVKAGKSVTVKATVKTTGKDANKKLVWSCSNSIYATINGKGKVTAKKAGKGKTIKITARATDGSNVEKSVKIRIK